MALNAELTVKLDAGTLVNTFLQELTGKAGPLGSVAAPATPDDVSSASGGGSSFLPQSLLDTVKKFGTELPIPQIPGVLQDIEGTLVTIEGITEGDFADQIQALTVQVTQLLESSDQDGLPGILLKIADVPKTTPLGASISGILQLFLGGVSDFAPPKEIADYVPAFASSVKVIAGLMTYETVLEEGERLMQSVAMLFQAPVAQRMADSIQASFTVGGTPLAQLLSGIDLSDTGALDGAIRAVEQSASRLEALEDYVSQGMGFGEATLQYYDPGRAQTELAIASVLLRNPDLTSLKIAAQSLANLAAPVTSLLDPGQAAVLGINTLIQLAESQVAQAVSAIKGLDAGPLVNPLHDGIAALTSPLHAFTDIVTQAIAEIQSALQQVRSAIAALPIQDIVKAIQDVLKPVTDALNFLKNLVDRIRDALETAAKAALAILADIEGSVDKFGDEIRALFDQAKQFIDSLHLDQVVGTISDQINAFVGLLQKAQMKPYFDTASSAIGTAADVISKVPLNLLPESMKPDLDAALQPIRDVDPQEVEDQIESLLEIQDGQFQLRSTLEDAVAGVQAKFEQVLKTLDEHHPKKYIAQIDEQLSALATRIQALTPQLTLEPVQKAIDEMKSALGSFDLEKELKPVQDVFDKIIQSIDQYSPVNLLEPLAERVDIARFKVRQLTRINDWIPVLDNLEAMATGQLTALNETVIEATLKNALTQLQEEAARLPNLGFSNWIGVIVAGLMRGSPIRIAASSMETVMSWMEKPGTGSASLSGRVQRMTDALATTRTQVQAFDPAAFTAVIQGANAVQNAVNALVQKLDAASTQRLQLQAAAVRLDGAGVLGGLSANRTRYLAVVTNAASLGDGLRSLGLTEVDAAVAQLRDARSPLDPLLAKIHTLASLLGIGEASTFGDVVAKVFAVASPERLAGVIMPLISAMRARLQNLIDEILAPVRAAINDLKALIALIDIRPIIASIEAVFTEIKTQIMAFSPDQLLKPELDAFKALQAELQAFDPLASLLEVLNGLRDTTVRVIGKLSAAHLLESPLAIYDTILNAIRQLDLNTLLTPVLDVLDDIAKQVDDGLDETVSAFIHLQESLPPPGGGSSASVSVSV